MLDEEKFKELATKAYNELRGMSGWNIHLFEDSMSEPVTGGTGFYKKDEGIHSSATEYVIKGWSPLDLPYITEQHEDKGTWYDCEAGEWRSDFSEEIAEWVEEDWNNYKEG